jgi:hypothetical protein
MKRRTFDFTRRSVVGGLGALAGLAAVGCSRAGTAESQQDQASPKSQAPIRAQIAMTVYRDPSCGCCEAWAALATKAGYRVSVIDRPDMAAIKKQYGVPVSLHSCHTAIVGGYAIEGHVPLEQVAKLLETKPAGVKGLAVPGMPRGSPGMEMPDGSKDPFEVMAFDAAGNSRVFAA